MRLIQNAYSRTLQINEDMSEPSLDDYDLIPIEQIPTTGSQTHDKINRLNREHFGLIPQVHWNQEVLIRKDMRKL